MIHKLDVVQIQLNACKARGSIFGFSKTAAGRDISPFQILKSFEILVSLPTGRQAMAT